MTSSRTFVNNNKGAQINAQKRTPGRRCAASADARPDGRVRGHVAMVQPKSGAMGPMRSPIVSK